MKPWYCLEAGRSRDEADCTACVPLEALARLVDEAKAEALSEALTQRDLDLVAVALDINAGGWAERGGTYLKIYKDYQHAKESVRQLQAMIDKGLHT